MLKMPNPFDTGATPVVPVEAAASPNLAGADDAAADPFDGPDIPLVELVKRGFDPHGFLNDCEPLPAFLSAPSQAYEAATELPPVLQVLAKF